MIWLLSCLSPTAWETADALAARARVCKGDEKDRAVAAALQAYERLLQSVAKDRKLAPRVRRRRAAVLKNAGRVAEALAEHDAIVAGRARRRDKARALLDGARLLRDPERAVERLSLAMDRYADLVRARAALERGVALEKLGRLGAAERSYRIVVEKCRSDEKEAIAAFDSLALLELRRGRRGSARRWIRLCFTTYEKRAARGDRKGAFLGRQLGAMKAPAALAKASSAPVR
jgi:tetratricopeptide (TPR) repeat protein